MPDTTSVREIIVQARQIMRERGVNQGHFKTWDGQVCIRGAVVIAIDPAFADRPGFDWAESQPWHHTIDSELGQQVEYQLDLATQSLTGEDLRAVEYNNNGATWQDLDRVFEKALELVSA